MNVCIIGATGHIGSHLVPMLRREGIGVALITRGRLNVPAGIGWEGVRIVNANYAADDPNWQHALGSALDGVDALIDLLGVDLSATYDAARGRCAHVIACGSIWMLGMPRSVPCPPVVQAPFHGEAYARRWAVIEAVLARSRAGGPLFTAILPPNICGPGKIPLDTRGTRSIDVHRALAAGAEAILPDGADVLIGPCDAEDVAQGFFLAATQPERSAARVFNVGSAYALTAAQFIATYAQIHGVTIPVRRVSWDEFTRIVPDPGARYHFQAHMCPDITLTREQLGYIPRHTPEQSMRRAVEWMRTTGLLPGGGS